jgi:hypothetical protein
MQFLLPVVVFIHNHEHSESGGEASPSKGARIQKYVDLPKSISKSTKKFFSKPLSFRVAKKYWEHQRNVSPIKNYYKKIEGNFTS